ncbi:MAG: SpoIIE family protein phosphatase [Candidatus Cloacimonetes bacterium]|nr:SpoIIE family protein phosphatase [Candidatus Cloacimonadota bacterium]
MQREARILVVDDDEVIISIITNILKRNDYRTDHCYSGEIALQKIADNSYDLVLLDVQMGTGLDGYATCKLMHQYQPDLPVILVTANHDDASVNRGFESGSSDFIKKPVSRLELLARVNNIITLKRSEMRNLQLIDALRKDLSTAAIIQQAMLPKWVFLDNNMLFSSYYEACEAVGGDLFDRIKLDDNKYVVYIGDVSGHGVQAALLMSAIKSSIKLMIEAHKDTKTLAELFTKLNERFYQDLFLRNNYLTLLMGVIDLEMQEFRYLSAGHPPLIVIDSLTNDITIHDTKGSVPMGWMAHTNYSEDDIGHFPLSASDIFLIFTDGIYECSNPQNEQLGIAGLTDLIKNKLDIDSCISMPYKIKHCLMANNYETSADDFSLFAFQMHAISPAKTSNLPEAKEKRVKHHRIILRSALKEVGKTALECEKLILDWTMDSLLAAKVELIVDEFLNNIIIYGYNYQEDAEIVMEFMINSQKLSIRFWDTGIEWVPENYTYNIDYPYDFELDGLQSSGRGIRIIMSMSNHFVRVRYANLNETTVEISL